MHSISTLTVSRERQKPASSIVKPTCIPNTRNAAISVHIVLMGLTMSEPVRGSPSAANTLKPIRLGFNTVLANTQTYLLFWVDFSKRLFVALARANADHVLDWQDKNLPIAELASPGRLRDCINHVVHHLIWNNYLYLYLGNEVDLVFA